MEAIGDAANARGGLLMNIQPDPARAEAAISQQHTYREHVHRDMMEPIEQCRFVGVSLAFWPTCRHANFEQPAVANFNCQRCGAAIAPTAGWWCEECNKIIPWLQQVKGMSMIQICLSGESDPPWHVWVQDHAPWLIAGRIDILMDSERIAVRRDRKKAA